MSKSVGVQTNPESVVLAPVAIEDNSCSEFPVSVQKVGSDSCSESLPFN